MHTRSQVSPRSPRRAARLGARADDGRSGCAHPGVPAGLRGGVINMVGTYAGRCAAWCGVDHSRMPFTVKVVDRPEYDRHMVELKAEGQTSSIETGRISRA
jgi:hypothetical protein